METPCKLCGKQFRTRSRRAIYCSNACRLRDHYEERMGRPRRPLLLPAERVRDGLRRCLWCQCEISGPHNKLTCSVACKGRVARHNKGEGNSSYHCKELLIQEVRQ